MTREESEGVWLHACASCALSNVQLDMELHCETNASRTEQRSALSGVERCLATAEMASRWSIDHRGAISAGAVDARGGLRRLFIAPAKGWRTENLAIERLSDKKNRSISETGFREVLTSIICLKKLRGAEPPVRSSRSLLLLRGPRPLAQTGSSSRSRTGHVDSQLSCCGRSWATNEPFSMGKSLVPGWFLGRSPPFRFLAS